MSRRMALDGLAIGNIRRRKKALLGKMVVALLSGERRLSLCGITHKVIASKYGSPPYD